jgi:hypothetical protein
MLVKMFENKFDFLYLVAIHFFRLQVHLYL